MKGQSNRLQNMDPPDDWVNGSWTVDCICGVNFDDGEEMVNCDECGVWVHTRCSRYVKGDDIFVCDKCKGKNERNDREETEVAQLLVELPTKTMSMESAYICNEPSRRPLRLWTDIPIEERVHVHGVPGGDHALFSGLSSIFTPQLWNCTGYVPKKFNFQYREFPCWDEDRPDNTDNEKNDNSADKGAGVLFSLSKDSVLATPVAALIGVRSKVEDVSCDRNGLLSEKQGVSEDLDRCAENGVRERSFLRPLILHSGKCKKEDSSVSKDQSGKIKSTPSDKATNMKKRIDHAKTVFTSMNDDKQSAGRDLKHFRGDSENPKNKSSRGMVVRESSSDLYDVANKNVDKSKCSFELSSDIVSFETVKTNSVSAVAPKEENGVQIALAVENSTKTDGVALPLSAKKDVGNVVMKQGSCTALDYLDDGVEGNFRSAVKTSVEGLASSAHEIKDAQIHQDVKCGNSVDSSKSDAKSKIEKQHDVSGEALNFQASLHADATELQKCKDCMHESCKVNSGGTVCGSQLDGHKAEFNRSSEAASNFRLEKADEQCSNPCEFKQELDWPEGNTKVHISSMKPQNGSEVGAEKPSKSGGMVFHQSVSPSQHKTTLCAGMSSPASANIIVSKPSISNDSKPADPENLQGTSAKHETVSGSCGGSRKERSSIVDRDEEREKLPRRRVKEHPSAAANSLYSRDLQDPISKRTASQLKDSVVLSTVKSSMVHVSDSSGNSESVESHLNHKGSTAQNKSADSCFPQKVDKPNQTNILPPSKVNQRHATAMCPPATTNPSAVLSDEELAFLLHQELNSSPRVPRVPRLRQPGSSPQLGSPNATSMLIKRSSSSRGRDHATRRQETSNSAEASKREENGAQARLNALKKGLLSAYARNTASSGPSSSVEANDHNNSSIRNSPRNTSDDDTGTVGEGSVHHTLPGLINEIMSKGRRMTYEELCNAVLPHWHNLRKHNGERYAYSSHSQAVLDCLRNRHEWAQLVDRGPKTNSSRKRRKFDVEESEDSEYGKGRTAKATEGKGLETQKEEFPKRKRNTRKRKLALQGKGIKEIRKRRKMEMFTDDDDGIGLLSDSSDESVFSEDELQDVDECSERREASGSDD